MRLRSIEPHEVKGHEAQKQLIFLTTWPQKRNVFYSFI